MEILNQYSFSIDFVQILHDEAHKWFTWCESDTGDKIEITTSVNFQYLAPLLLSPTLIPKGQEVEVGALVTTNHQS